MTLIRSAAKRFKERAAIRGLVFVILVVLQLSWASAQTFLNITVNPGETVITRDLPNGRLIEILKKEECDSFILVPAENLWGHEVRGFLYLIGLLYFFLGIAIVADLFMAAIEVITSKVRTVTEIGPDGEEETIELRVWNATVANLTLMALGSSAPEILLAVIETVMNLGKEPGELGPSTIVGSAAFNLLVISAVCVVSVPKGEIRRIEELGVFLVTAFASIFAYVWLLFVLEWNGKSEVDMLEAWLTLLFFPVLVLISWCQDKGWKFGKKSTVHTERHQRLVSAHMQDDDEAIAERVKVVAMINATTGKPSGDHDEAHGQEKAAKDVARALIAEKRRTHPVSRAQYRINAVRGFAGRKRVVPSHHAKEGAADFLNVAGHEATANRPSWDKHIRATFGFGSPAYSVNEDDGSVAVEVTCDWDKSEASKADTSPIQVRLTTRDGTACAPDDYQAQNKIVEFKPGVESQTVMIPIVDDNEFEGDEVFYVTLGEPSDGTALGRFAVAAVTIIDNDLPGEFNFSNKRYATRESDGSMILTVTRTNGASGNATVRYKTQDGSAFAGKDYEATEGELKFAHGESSHTIEVKIINMPDNESDETFTVLLSDPAGGPTIGKIPSATVIITDDEAFLRLVGEATKYVEQQMKNFEVTSDSWTQQFKDAMSIGGEIGEDGEELPPSGFDYLMHFLTFMWKILFATVPPTAYAGGWAAFGISLLWVGALTSIVAELASLFGCVVGLKDSITAITFVALGTSLPDTFASKQATIQEETADTAIGNVTGSNAVNVFLGLGLPWVIAVFYHEANKDTLGKNYPVPAGDLSFSVTVFVICGIICLLTLLVRRMKFCGGELGGPVGLKYATAALFVLMWLIYVILSSIKATNG